MHMVTRDTLFKCYDAAGRTRAEGPGRGGDTFLFTNINFFVWGGHENYTGQNINVHFLNDIRILAWKFSWGFCYFP